MVARAHYQDHWVLNLYRATQVAIGQQLKIEYEPPRELTAELTIVCPKDRNHFCGQCLIGRVLVFSPHSLIRKGMPF